MNIRYGTLWATLVLLVSCVGAPASRPDIVLGAADSAGADSPPGAQQKWVEATILSMTSEDLIGQMIFLSLRNQPRARDNQNFHPGMAQSISEIQPGGIIIFSENVGTYEGLRSLIQNWQRASRIPLLISVDEEGGLVSRLKDLAPRVPVLPSLASVSQWETAMVKSRVGALASALSHLGIHMNLAPVADLTILPANPIGTRSPGKHPQKAADLVSLIIEELQAHGVSAVVKHFPGLGGTTVDTHHKLPSIPVDFKTFMEREAIPFYQSVQVSVDGIMIGHVSVPNLTGEWIPAPMSARLIQDMLRKGWGFQGLILTDALDMGAINDGLTPERVIPAAVLAGVDVLLMPQDPVRVKKILLNALESGVLTRERLEESVRRILNLKWKRIAGLALTEVESLQNP